MDSLRNIEVIKISDHIGSHFKSFFSQERRFHAAVVIQEEIIIIGGLQSSNTGEIVKGKFYIWKIISCITCYDQ